MHFKRTGTPWWTCASVQAAYPFSADVLGKCADLSSRSTDKRHECSQHSHRAKSARLAWAAAKAAVAAKRNQHLQRRDFFSSPGTFFLSVRCTHIRPPRAMSSVRECRDFAQKNAKSINWERSTVAESCCSTCSRTQ